MGKPAHAIEGNDVVSTVFSTVATLCSFVIPPAVHINSILDTLRKDVAEILGLTRPSKHRELIELGEHVDKMVNHLVSAFQNERLARHPNVIKDLSELQKTLYVISRRISYIRGCGGMLSGIRHIISPEEDQIPHMRQRLDDALRVFELGAFIKLLAVQPHPPTSETANRLESDQIRGSFGPPADNHPSKQRRQPPQIIGEVQGYRTRPRPFPLQLAHSHFGAAGATRDPVLEDDEIVAAQNNVKRLRRSIQQSQSTTQRLELAAALGLLSQLLANAGRTAEALASSQESAEEYRTLAEIRR